MPAFAPLSTPMVTERFAISRAVFFRIEVPMDHVDGWNVNFDIFEYSPITAARIYGDAVLKDIDTHIKEGVYESPDTPVRIQASEEFHGKLKANGK